MSKKEHSSDAWFKELERVLNDIPDGYEVLFHEIGCCATKKGVKTFSSEVHLFKIGHIQKTQNLSGGDLMLYSPGSYSLSFFTINQGLAANNHGY